MNIRNVFIIFIFLTFAFIVSAHAQTEERLDITAKSVEGDVEIMAPDTSQWIPLKTGDTFSEETQVRTGPLSSVSLDFSDSSVAMVNSFTFMTVEKFFKSGNDVTTRLKLNIGSVVSTLNDGSPFRNDYKIVTPSLTTSLKGREIKKVEAGGMYKDSVNTGYRQEDQNSAGKISQKQQIQRESSIAVPPK